MVFRRRNRPIYAPKPRVSQGQPLSDWERYFERAMANYDTFATATTKTKKKPELLDEALADIDEAIGIMPRNGELYIARALILLEQNKESDAIDDLNYALQVDQRQWAAHYIKGYLAYNKKKYDEAIEELSLSQRFAPLRPEVLFTRALAYYARGESQRAHDDMDSAIQVMENKSKRRTLANKFIKQVKKELKTAKSK